MAVKYWHELPIGAQKELYRSKMTYGDFTERYKQPAWCNYPGALMGQMGCWSLTIPGKIRGPENCSRECPCRVELKK